MAIQAEVAAAKIVKKVGKQNRICLKTLNSLCLGQICRVLVGNLTGFMYLCPIKSPGPKRELCVASVTIVFM